MRRMTRLSLHGAALAGLLGAAGALATVRGALWPFDIRAAALMTASGLAGVAAGWGAVWLAPLGLSAALPKSWQRLLLWPVAVLAMVLLHAAFGPARGFAPLPALGGAGAVALYAVPVALALLCGSALRVAFGRGPQP